MKRKRIFEIIELSDGDRLSSIYDLFMIAIIFLSLFPLAFKESSPFLSFIDFAAVVVFIFDYLLRLLTADYKLQRGPFSFLLYPFSPLALMDLLCILPSFTALSAGFRLLKVIRLFRALRIFRAAKILRYSRSLITIAEVIREQKAALLSVGAFALGYVFVSALVIFNVEPDSFGNFFEAVYWAVVSLTTVGYGDIYPITVAGRIITMLSSLCGIAVVALPSGIITAGYLSKIQPGGNS